MRNILITNDDGIDSDGIIRLARAATKYGKVWVIAPDGQRSAASHMITLRTSILVRKVDFPVEGVEAYATDGSPADCVRFGMLNIVKGKTDVVFSGINYGYNSGTDIQYSATVGAAMEAATVGVHAIAFSECMCEEHETADAYLDRVIEELIDAPLGDNQIWNVNFPKGTAAECKGIIRDRSVARNAFYKDKYDEEVLADGTLRLTVNGTYYEDALDGTDVKAIIDHYVSIGIINNLK